jgi:hypothetical protein
VTTLLSYLQFEHFGIKGSCLPPAIMSPTAFRKGTDLLKYAGSDKEELGILQISNREPFGEVYVTNASLKPYAREFFNLFDSNYAGRWIHQAVDSETEAVSTSISTSPEPIKRPRVQVSPALVELNEITYASRKPESMLAYVIVIQGKSGSDCSKVIWKHNRIDIARAMFEEVINGYSVVFSGAMLVDDYQRLNNRRDGWKVSFTTAGSFPTLREVGQANAKANREAERYAAWQKSRRKGQSHWEIGTQEWKKGMNRYPKLGLFC